MSNRQTRHDLPPHLSKLLDMTSIPSTSLNVTKKTEIVNQESGSFAPLVLFPHNGVYFDKRLPNDSQIATRHLKSRLLKNWEIGSLGTDVQNCLRIFDQKKDNIIIEDLSLSQFEPFGKDNLRQVSVYGTPNDTFISTRPKNIVAINKYKETIKTKKVACVESLSNTTGLQCANELKLDLKDIFEAEKYTLGSLKHTSTNEGSITSMIKRDDIFKCEDKDDKSTTKDLSEKLLDGEETPYIWHQQHSIIENSLQHELVKQFDNNIPDHIKVFIPDKLSQSNSKKQETARTYNQDMILNPFREQLDERTAYACEESLSKTTGLQCANELKLDLKDIFEKEKYTSGSLKHTSSNQDSISSMMKLNDTLKRKDEDDKITTKFDIKLFLDSYKSSNQETVLSNPKDLSKKLLDGEETPYLWHQQHSIENSLQHELVKQFDNNIPDHIKKFFPDELLQSNLEKQETATTHNQDMMLNPFSKQLDERTVYACEESLSKTTGLQCANELKLDLKDIFEKEKYTSGSLKHTSSNQDSISAMIKPNDTLKRKDGDDKSTTKFDIKLFLDSCKSSNQETVKLDSDKVKLEDKKLLSNTKDLSKKLLDGEETPYLWHQQDSIENSSEHELMMQFDNTTPDHIKRKIPDDLPQSNLEKQKTTTYNQDMMLNPFSKQLDERTVYNQESKQYSEISSLCLSNSSTINKENLSPHVNTAQQAGWPAQKTFRLKKKSQNARTNLNRLLAKAGIFTPEYVCEMKPLGNSISQKQKPVINDVIHNLEKLFENHPAQIPDNMSVSDGSDYRVFDRFLRDNKREEQKEKSKKQPIVLMDVSLDENINAAGIDYQQPECSVNVVLPFEEEVSDFPETPLPINNRSMGANNSKNIKSIMMMKRKWGRVKSSSSVKRINKQTLKTYQRRNLENSKNNELGNFNNCLTSSHVGTNNTSRMESSKMKRIKKKSVQSGQILCNIDYIPNSDKQKITLLPCYDKTMTCIQIEKSSKVPKKTAFPTNFKKNASSDKIRELPSTRKTLINKHSRQSNQRHIFGNPRNIPNIDIPIDYICPYFDICDNLKERQSSLNQKDVESDLKNVKLNRTRTIPKQNKKRVYKKTIVESKQVSATPQNIFWSYNLRNVNREILERCEQMHLESGCSNAKIMKKNELDTAIRTEEVCEVESCKMPRASHNYGTRKAMREDTTKSGTIKSKRRRKTTEE